MKLLLLYITMPISISISMCTRCIMYAIPLALMLLLSCRSENESFVIRVTPKGWTYGYTSIFYNDSTCIDSDGFAKLWHQDRDSIHVIRDIFRNENNCAQFDYASYAGVPDFSIQDFAWLGKIYSSLQLTPKKEKRALDAAIKRLNKGKFELIVGNFYYRHINEDSIGIFNSKAENRKYRMINGIEGYCCSFQLTENPVGYDFSCSLRQRSLSVNGDTLPPFWCRGQFPKNIKRVILPQETEIILDYGEKQYLWICIVPNQIGNIGERPINMPKKEAYLYIEERFPTYHRFTDLYTIKKDVIDGLKENYILKRTDKCTLIATGIKEENLPVFETMLSNCFVEVPSEVTDLLYKYCTGYFKSQGIKLFSEGNITPELKAYLKDGFPWWFFNKSIR